MTCGSQPANEIAASVAENCSRLLAVALEHARLDDPHRFAQLEKLSGTGLLTFGVRVAFTATVDNAVVEVLALDGTDPRLEIGRFHVGRESVS